MMMLINNFVCTHFKINKTISKRRNFIIHYLKIIINENKYKVKKIHNRILPRYFKEE